jgi:hypothetical protein
MIKRGVRMMKGGVTIQFTRLQKIINGRQAPSTNHQLLTSPHINLRVVAEIESLAHAADGGVITHEGVMKEHIVKHGIAADDGIFNDARCGGSVFADRHIRSYNAIDQFAVIRNAYRFDDNGVF